MSEKPQRVESEEEEVSSGRRFRSDSLIALLSDKVVGQMSALEVIIPSIQVHRSGLAPEGRPVGIFLLLGPTGTGKTKTVEEVAEVLHGDAKKVVRIDCGEFQKEHEMAKLIGAPPGYVGHADSKPRFTQETLAEVMSPGCNLALVLFDEIEKASSALVQLLLGVLDHATLRLGDGAVVDFTDTIIFLTSNLGAREMMNEIQPSLGFHSGQIRKPAEMAARIERVGLHAVQKHFSPEFVNRIDAVVTYRPLDATSIVAILDQHIVELQQHVNTRLGGRAFEIHVAPAARYFMIDKGTSLEYGARELRRVVHRNLTQPLAAMVANGEVSPGATLTVDLGEDGESLQLSAEGGVAIVPSEIVHVLGVDDNADLLRWMRRVLTERGFEVTIACSVEEAGERVAVQAPDAAILDYVLPDGDGVSLARALLDDLPDLAVVMMSGMDLDEADRMLCRNKDIPILTKPFLADELIATLDAQSPVSPLRAHAKGG
jgi:ATP-dependent Clp protease ATP-binding subunit ClpA/ActR/RegA family two-component response regulator